MRGEQRIRVLHRELKTRDDWWEWRSLVEELCRFEKPSREEDKWLVATIAAMATIGPLNREDVHAIKFEARVQEPQNVWAYMHGIARTILEERGYNPREEMRSLWIRRSTFDWLSQGKSAWTRNETPDERNRRAKREQSKAENETKRRMLETVLEIQKEEHRMKQEAKQAKRRNYER